MAASAVRSLVTVKHNKAQEYFYIEDRNCNSTLEYEKTRDVVTILHTEVPDVCGGQGYGKMLAAAALSWIQENNYRVKIECEFFQHYLLKYRPDLKKLLIE